jgi:hypothetical protein
MTFRGLGRAALLVATLAPMVLAACNAAGGSPDPYAPVVVTFEVVDERFKVLLTEPADIDIARRLLAGEDVPSIPNGRIVHETGVNAGYSWSLDPNDIEFVEDTIEDCDGLPSDVETAVVAGDRYCPWAATVIGVEPAR